MYSSEEKIELYDSYLRGSSLREVSAHFSVEYPLRPVPSIGGIRKIISNIRRTGCTNSHHRINVRPRQRRIDEDTRISILAAVEVDKRRCVRQLATEFNLSVGSVHKVLKQGGYKSYRFQNHQELLPQDPESRSNFCETTFEAINEDRILLNSICFTDECTFTLHGEVNSQNCRYWSTENLRLYNATRTQHPQSINVWAGIIDRRIVGPFFIDGALNAVKYRQLLQERIIPALRQFENETGRQVWFQQDGAPPHYALTVREILNNQFGHRWIGRGGGINWPARSPDLNPLDFYYWGRIKSAVYTNVPPADIDELKQRIITASREIPENHIDNVVHGFYDRLGHCLAMNGGIFENLL